MNIVNVCTRLVTEVPIKKFPTPNAFIFLYDAHVFLTFRGSGLCAWTAQGELLTDFPSAHLLRGESTTNNVFITLQQDALFAYCRGRYDQPVVQMFSMRSGTCMSSNEFVHDAFEGVCALHYNHDNNMLYTGRPLMGWSRHGK